MNFTLQYDWLQFVNISIIDISMYRIAQNFGGRKHWRIWRLGTNSPPKFYPPKFSITLVFYRCSTQSANVFSTKYILSANPPKFCAIRYFPYKVGWKMTGSLSSVGAVIIYPSTHCTVSNCFLSCPQGFTGLQFSQVNSHIIQPPQVVGVAMDMVASYPLSFNHSVRCVQDHLVLIG